MEGWKSKQTVAANAKSDREREGGRESVSQESERVEGREEGGRGDLFGKFCKLGSLAHCCLRGTHGWSGHKAEPGSFLSRKQQLLTRLQPFHAPYDCLNACLSAEVLHERLE